VVTCSVVASSPGPASPSPDEVLLVDDDVVMTRAELGLALDRCERAMLAAAADPAQRVGVVGENRAETLLAHAAGIRAGVGTVALAKGLAARELVDQCRDGAVVAVVTGPLGLPAVVEAAAEAGVGRVVVCGAQVPAGSDGLVVTWEDWLAAAPVRDTLPATVRPANPPLVYTSGTTGRARGTHVRWATLEGSSGDYLDRLCSGFHGPYGPHLVVGPLQHNGPLTAVRNLLGGCPVVVLGKFDAERVLALVVRWRITTSVMVPTHFVRLLALPEDVRARYDVSSLKQVAHTGSACPADVKRAMIDWFGPVLLESYGGTECGTVTRITSEEWLRHPRSVGRVVPPFRLVVVDESGDEVATGQVGILAFVAPEDRRVVYHSDPEKTAKAYVRPDAFTLGDVGLVDEEGFVYITDRITDMVVSGGVNLYPAESENVLVEHPKVAEVAVIGIPHPDLGEQLLALVVPEDPHDPPTPAELEAWCRRQLASFKCPRRYELVDTLARNAMSKLDKRALRQPYWADARTMAG
jgi:acyl-CoA synthetase (AMP-forming)/AMP-acid ligase II